MRWLGPDDKEPKESKPPTRFWPPTNTPTDDDMAYWGLSLIERARHYRRVHEWRVRRAERLAREVSAGWSRIMKLIYIMLGFLACSLIGKIGRHLV